MEKNANSENADSRIVIIGLCVSVVVAILLCVLIYINQTRTIQLNVDEFEIQNNENSKAVITNVSQDEKYLKVEGKCIENIETYEIYIALQDVRWIKKNI
jgi:hypothetical protein